MALGNDLFVQVLGAVVRLPAHIQPILVKLTLLLVIGKKGNIPQVSLKTIIKKSLRRVQRVTVVFRTLLGSHWSSGVQWL